MTMAGAIRQPIDIASLERFIANNVPDIKVPVDVKQVSCDANVHSIIEYNIADLQ